MLYEAKTGLGKESRQCVTHSRYVGERTFTDLILHP